MYYLVFANFYGDISYGEQSKTYLVNIFQTEAEAINAINEYEKSVKPFGSKLYFKNKYGIGHKYLIEEGPNLKNLYDDPSKYTVAKYCDAEYEMVIFDNNAPIIVADFMYAE